MNADKTLSIAALALIMAGCGGGEGGIGYCVGSFQGGSTSFSCTTCSGPDVFESNPFQLAIDNDAKTLRTFGFSAGSGNIVIRIDAPPGMTFPAGADAGALIRFPRDIPVSASYSLYRSNAPVAATSGAAITTSSPAPGGGTPTYYPVVPASAIDRIDLTFSANTGTSAVNFDLIEVCGDR